MSDSTLGSLLHQLALIEARGYFNWSNADQVDRLLITLELRRRAASLRVDR